ncbi:MAG: hypothetical protein AAF984_03280 [Verrucomicrobiota bacterium]
MMNKIFLAALILLTTGLTAYADFFKIYTIKKTKKYAYVEKAWKYDVETLEVTFSALKEMPGKKVNYKLYVYDKNKELLQKHKKPTSVSPGDGTSYMRPNELKPNKRHKVFFGMSEKHTKGVDKWRYAIVEIEHDGSSTKLSYPRSIDLSEFDRPD